MYVEIIKEKTAADKKCNTNRYLVAEMDFLKVKSLGAEKKDFVLHREDIGEQYIFTHFLTPVTALLRGESVDIKPGGCVFFGMNSMQHFSSTLCELLHDWFHADSGCTELMDRYGLECERVYYPSDSDEITRMIGEIEIEYINKEENYEKVVSAIAETMFIKLARSSGNSSPQTAVNYSQKQAFIKARAKIHMSLSHRWTVEEMAELVNLSPSRFYSLYKAMFGISPQQDLIRKRIQTAQILLDKQEFTVCEVAKLTGYGNQYHFIRQFREMTGMTPGSFLKKNGRQP